MRVAPAHRVLDHRAVQPRQIPNHRRPTDLEGLLLELRAVPRPPLVAHPRALRLVPFQQVVTRRIRQHLEDRQARLRLHQLRRPCRRTMRTLPRGMSGPLSGRAPSFLLRTCRGEAISDGLLVVEVGRGTVTAMGGCQFAHARMMSGGRQIVKVWRTVAGGGCRTRCCGLVGRREEAERGRARISVAGSLIFFRPQMRTRKEKWSVLKSRCGRAAVEESSRRFFRPASFFFAAAGASRVGLAERRRRGHRVIIAECARADLRGDRRWVRGSGEGR